MKRYVLNSDCAGCGISRRQFLTSCAMCAGAAVLSGKPEPVRAGENNGKMRIRIVYSLHAVKQPRPDWPNIG
ncbi:MAG: twin-arginine translocation signal domain-containing protein, partial [Phycisphaerae bacterium]|nr:twin-arginine translocation signal domain-containing protein [Phycisphaerae bacterium]NIU07726.1 twin-arginine translocation signal domain-containing protein [Phycisphaerae bacterium]NIU55350.1 twin-arginine translocation signal domain-containing protein [Phycisphaerae bacterium]NIW91817.1 twin-arginine translocation signal domain-containing protein [Phycisphaerae bacterium]